MQTRKNDNAFPNSAAGLGASTLSKREWFTGQALAAGETPLSAINYADETIRGLNLTTTTGMDESADPVVEFFLGCMAAGSDPLPEILDIYKRWKELDLSDQKDFLTQLSLFLQDRINEYLKSNPYCETGSFSKLIAPTTPDKEG